MVLRASPVSASLLNALPVDIEISLSRPGPRCSGDLYVLRPVSIGNGLKMPYPPPPPPNAIQLLRVEKVDTWNSADAGAASDPLRSLRAR